jgi:hypothetical protein
MRFVQGCGIAIALTLCTSSFAFAQDAAMPVKDGGIFAKGWAGKIDAQEEKAGANINQARLDEKGGTFIARGMGPAPFTAQATRKPEPNEAVAKAAGKNSPVKQDIAVTVTADTIDCAINGKVVGTYKKADLVAAGKLKSTDGVYGIRFAHNTEATVTNFKMTKK